MPRGLTLLLIGCGALAVRAGQADLMPPIDPPASEVKTAPVKTVTAPATITSAASPLSTPAVPKVGDSLPFHHDDSDIPDSIGAITVRPVPEPDEPEPAYLKQVDFYRAHHDCDMAASYLEKVAVNPNLSARDRPQAILVLADALEAVQRRGDELCWLKVWLQLYPARSEVGGVAYRMGALYTHMGLTELARDSFYLALSNAVNHGQVQGEADLQRYAKLTTGTLWALALNEYKSGDWKRAAELFDRFRHEAQSPPPGQLVRAQFLQADCYYQQHDRDKASAAYTAVLKDHPFHPLAPEARLSMYHLDLMAKKPADAQNELQALIWTVRSIWPQDEGYWQQRTAQLLLALNHANADTLPPLLKKSAELAGQDKAWQAELGHYDKLASLIATMPHDFSPTSPFTPTGAAPGGLSEQEDLNAMNQSIQALAPPHISAGKNP